MVQRVKFLQEAACLHDAKDERRYWEMQKLLTTEKPYSRIGRKSKS